MDSKAKFGLYILGGIILLMLIGEVVRPRPINWDDSYTSFDKTPLGCYVLNNELKELNNTTIIYSNSSIAESNVLFKNTKKNSLLLVNNYIDLDERETNNLLDYVANGNNVFISALDIEGAITDTLQFETNTNNENNFVSNTLINGFYNPALNKQEYNFSKVIRNSYFSEIDSTKTIALGYAYNPNEIDEKYTNFIKIPFGTKNGAFYLHTNPYAFTNYHMIYSDKNYAEASLAYITNSNIIWDDYYKAGKRRIDSPLRYVLQQGSLKFAIYLAVITLILFVIFRGKRTQRIIPVVEPVKNHSLEFTRSIGNLYFSHKDYTNVIQKKITFFLAHVRSKFYLDTNNLNARFIKNLAIKARKTEDETNDVVKYILYLNSKPIHTEEDLIDLNTKIERFLKQ